MELSFITVSTLGWVLVIALIMRMATLQQTIFLDALAAAEAAGEITARTIRGLEEQEGVDSVLGLTLRQTEEVLAVVLMLETARMLELRLRTLEMVAAAAAEQTELLEFTTLETVAAARVAAAVAVVAVLEPTLTA
jgi:hypothetical protein